MVVSSWYWEVKAFLEANNGSPPHIPGGSPTLWVFPHISYLPLTHMRTRNRWRSACISGSRGRGDKPGNSGCWESTRAWDQKSRFSVEYTRQTYCIPLFESGVFIESRHVREFAKGMRRVDSTSLRSLSQIAINKVDYHTRIAAHPSFVRW